MALRLAYTHHKRRNGQELPLASNALPFEAMFADLPPSYDEKDVIESHIRARSVSSGSSSSKSLDDVDGISIPEEFNDKDLDEGFITSEPSISKYVAIFPQYIAVDKTTLTIREVDIPRFRSSFSVFMPNGETLFRVDRQIVSLSARQYIIDPKNNDTVLSVRHDIGKLPRSYRFDDESERKVLDLQGNFFVPTQGTRATAFFTNAVDQSKVQLFMQGSWRNRKAAIKNVATGEVLATMESELLNLRNLVASRRTYKVTVSKGVDMAVITGMIVALDARSS